ncbi:MAG: hypothetical protein E7297_11300 [Lachnospiraceae bacterium]|jgi:hypothetical protein|nr:hypothetical protein [Lachnospiraceae bacterium]
MDRESFITELRMALSGKVNPAVIEENISYYNEYITGQVRMGQTEEEVLDALGNPRLIAKSIIEATKHAEGTDYYQEGDTESYQDSQDTEPVPATLWQKLAVVYRNLPAWGKTTVRTLGVVVGAVVLFQLAKVLVPILLVVYLFWFLRRLFRGDDLY